MSSDQLPRRASARSPTSGAGATPTISCPYYKSELYIVSEEQAFRSQHGRPFRNDDVADCIAIASATPPSVMGPHRSFLRSPDVTVGGTASSYYGSQSPASASSAATSSAPLSLSASGLSSIQQNRPESASRRSLTESKWKWLHSNAMVPEQPSPDSLRRTTRLDIPSTSPLRQDVRQESGDGVTTAGSRKLGDGRLVVSDSQDQARASRVYYSKTAVDRSAPVGEQLQHRKTTVDLIQSVSDVYRSAQMDDPSVRHWRHSSDDTSQRLAADPNSRKWDSYGLTLSLSGAAVSRSGQMLETDVAKPHWDLSTNGQASNSSVDLPQKLPIEKILRFDNPSAASQRPNDRLSLAAATDSPSTKDADTSQSVSPSLIPKTGRSGRLSVPDSIPIYFRAEQSASQSRPSSSCVEMEAGRGENKTMPFSTDGYPQPSLSTRSHSSTGSSMFSVLFLLLHTKSLF